MAITVTTLQDGSHYRILQAHVDTADVTGSVIYDYAADSNKPADADPSKIRIMEYWGWASASCDGDVAFAGATSKDVLHLPAATAQHMCFEKFGGIRNIATTPTGNITLTTTSVNATNHIVFILLIKKF